MENEETTIRIPMYGEIRSLNLGNSVAIVLYRSTQAAGLSETQRWGIFIILIGKMARYRKLQRELFEKSSLFLQLFQMLNRYVGRKGKKQ